MPAVFIRKPATQPLEHLKLIRFGRAPRSCRRHFVETGAERRVLGQLLGQVLKKRLKRNYQRIAAQCILPATQRPYARPRQHSSIRATPRQHHPGHLSSAFVLQEAFRHAVAAQDRPVALNGGLPRAIDGSLQLPAILLPAYELPRRLGAQTRDQSVRDNDPTCLEQHRSEYAETDTG
jgi:hypothetical protein